MGPRIVLYIDLVSFLVAASGIIFLSLICLAIYYKEGRFEHFIVPSLAFLSAWAIPEVPSLLGWAVLGDWMYMHTLSAIVGVLGLICLAITALEARKGSDRLGMAALFSVGFFFLAWIFILPVTLSRFLLNN